jgi:hypothetical protein
VSCFKIKSFCLKCVLTLAWSPSTTRRLRGIKYFYLFVVLFFHLGLTAQDQEEIKRIPYLLIDEDINLNCQNYPYSKNARKGHVIKSKSEKFTFFFLCLYKFRAHNDHIEIIDTEQFNKLNLWSFGQRQYERLRKG